MKVGDLVRRKNIWKEWQAHNPWMTTDEESEIGIIVQWEGTLHRTVSWPITGLSWEDGDELEVVKYSKKPYNIIEPKQEKEKCMVKKKKTQITY